MTVKELDTMVKAMRTKYNKVGSRLELEDTLYNLYKGLFAINRDDIAEKLMKLYEEIDAIDTDELIKMGTFR